MRTNEPRAFEAFRTNFHQRPPYSEPRMLEEAYKSIRSNAVASGCGGKARCLLILGGGPLWSGYT